MIIQFPSKESIRMLGKPYREACPLELIKEAATGLCTYFIDVFICINIAFAKD